MVADVGGSSLPCCHPNRCIHMYCEYMKIMYSHWLLCIQKGMKSNSFCARYYHSLPWNLQILFFLTQTQLRQTPWETPPMEEAFSVKVFVFSALETGWDTLLGICRILFPPSLNFMLTQSHVQPLPYKSSSKKGQSTFFFFFCQLFEKKLVAC